LFLFEGLAIYGAARIFLAIFGKVGTQTKLMPENLESTPIIYVAAHLWPDAAEN
jgi:hypothetical protein